MDMRYFWVIDQAEQKLIKVEWHPGLENLADYFTKHFPKYHHLIMRHIYLHNKNSPKYLPRALPPAVLRGCVVTPSSYIKGLPTYVQNSPSKANTRYKSTTVRT